MFRLEGHEVRREGLCAGLLCMSAVQIQPQQVPRSIAASAGSELCLAGDLS